MGESGRKPDRKNPTTRYSDRGILMDRLSTERDRDQLTFM